VTYTTNEPPHYEIFFDFFVILSPRLSKYFVFSLRTLITSLSNARDNASDRLKTKYCLKFQYTREKKILQ
jgi:hypothetical protein